MKDFQNLFSLVAGALSFWSANPLDEKSNQKGDQVAAALCDSYKRLGQLFPSNFNAFGRDVFDVGKFHVEVAQYFKGANYYADDPSIKKLVRWSIFHGKSVIMRYYLERSELVLPCYILGLQTRADKSHTQVHVYGPIRPTYAKMKTDMLNDLSARMHDTIHQLKADEGAVQSTPHGLVSPRQDSARKQSAADDSFAASQSPLTTPKRGKLSQSGQFSATSNSSPPRDQPKAKSAGGAQKSKRATSSTQGQAGSTASGAKAKVGKSKRKGSVGAKGNANADGGSVEVVTGPDGKVAYKMNDGTELVVGDVEDSKSAVQKTDSASESDDDDDDESDDDESDDEESS